MWNGIWKLAVMVGVVGIGLFAVFQAQKEMHRVASEPQPGVVNEGESESISDRASLSEPDPLVVSLDPETGTAKQRKPRSTDDRIDLIRNVSPDSNTVKPAIGTAKTSTPTVALASSRRKGLSFQDEDESFAESFGETTAEPKPLPKTRPNNEESEEPFEPAPEKAMTETDDSGNVEDEAASQPQDASPASPGDPFADDSPSKSADTSALPVETENPKKAIDFGDDADFPRSKRGLEKSEPKPKAEEDDGLFDSEPKAMDAPPPVSPESDEAEEESFDSRQPAEPQNSDELNLSAPPASSRPAPLGAPNSDDEFNREVPSSSRGRPAMPAELDRIPPPNPRDRGREKQKPKVEIDQVTPDDMIGDGIVGDASQRGVQQPRLTIEKVAQQQAVLEQPLVYSIIVRNQGNVAAHNVVIEDRIPKGTELMGTFPRAELVDKTLIWKEPVLRPNEEKKISIKVIPKQEGPIGSVARVHFATEVSTEIQVAAPPQLEFTVNPPREIRVGQNVDLIFQLKNIGKVEATNISVRDVLPDHLRHESGNDVECPIGKLAPNEIREIVLTVTATRTGSGLNKAVLTADSGIQKQLESQIDVVSDQLVLTRTGHNRVFVERSAAFTNTIRNDGKMTASRVRVSEIVPAGMEFETASDGGRFDASQNAVVWTLGTLAPGDDKELTVKYIPKEMGTVIGKVTATGASGSSAEIQSKVEVVGRPEIQMETLSSTGSVTIGDKISSKFQLKNSGTSAARNVQLRVQIPPQLRLVSVKGGKFQKTKNVVVFEAIEELAPRSQAAFEFIMEPTEEAEARVVVEIYADHLTKPHRREETIQIARDSLETR